MASLDLDQVVGRGIDAGQTEDQVGVRLSSVVVTGSPSTVKVIGRTGRPCLADT